MASYTMPLKEMIEVYAGDELNYKDAIEKARKYLFDFDYPFFNETYRDKFETNFIKHFYTREIGFETEALFKLKLDSWLNLNMSYYNKMFESECLSFNPFHNTILDTTYNKKNDRSHETESNSKQEETKGRTQSDERNIDSKSNTSGTSTGESNSKASGTTNADNFERDINSSTPQNRLELTTRDGSGIIEYADSIEEKKQNNTTDSSSTGNTTSTDRSNVDGTSNTTDDYSSTSNEQGERKLNDVTTGTINTLEEYVQRQTGKTGSQSFSKMLEEYRSTFLRVERAMFNEMEELFMGVY